jgi:hypothetical protein
LAKFIGSPRKFQMKCIWKMPLHRLVFYLNYDVSETIFCLRLRWNLVSWLYLLHPTGYVPSEEGDIIQSSQLCLCPAILCSAPCYLHPSADLTQHLLHNRANLCTASSRAVRRRKRRDPSCFSMFRCYKDSDGVLRRGPRSCGLVAAGM